MTDSDFNRNGKYSSAGINKIVGDIDDKYVTEAAPKGTPEEEGKRAKRIRTNKIIRFTSIAACVVAVVTVGSLILPKVIAPRFSESKSYSDAIATGGASAAAEIPEGALNGGDMSFDIKDSDYSTGALGKDGDYFTDELAEAGVSPSGGEAIGYETENPVIIDDSKPFVLTAGVWNDNANWSFFTNIVNSDLITFPSYGVNPCNRVAITVKDASGNPVYGANVAIYDTDGKMIWAAKSDAKGVAYLFYDETTPVKATAGIGDVINGVDLVVKEVEQAQSDEQSQETQGSTKVYAAEAEIVIDTQAPKANSLQVMFIIDTTGSMSDELAYLQKDFASIFEEIGTEGVEYSMNFYRDEGDEYVTKTYDFTTDLDMLKGQLGAEVADGGGDFPEAVADILTDTMGSQGWKEDAVKIAFLVFDAPPHDETSDEVLAAVKSAAEQGIHLIPIVSSNSDRDTELFGRAISICTNSDYIFLTDDSGVGDGHLDPIIGDYEVELLHDILVREISGYKEMIG